MVQLLLKTVLPEILDKMRTFSFMWGPDREFTGPTSFEITVFLELIDKMRAFSFVWGPDREFTGPTSFENINLWDLFSYIRTS